MFSNPIIFTDPTGKAPNPPDWYENEYGQRKYFDGETRNEFYEGFGLFSGENITNLGDVKWTKVNSMGPTNDTYFASGDFGQYNEEGNFDNSKRVLDISGGIFDALHIATRPNEGTWLGKNGKYYNSSWGGNGHTGGRSVAYKAANNYKWAGRSTVVATTIIGGVEIHDGYQADGGEFGYHAQSATAQTIGGIGGGAAGGALGAEIGGAFGALFGGVGAIPGAIIGGFIGGWIGGEAGSSTGQGIVDKLHNK